jgi:hypothetical protein
MFSFTRVSEDDAVETACAVRVDNTRGGCVIDDCAGESGARGGEAGGVGKASRAAERGRVDDMVAWRVVVSWGLSMGV